MFSVNQKKYAFMSWAWKQHKIYNIGEVVSLQITISNISPNLNLDNCYLEIDKNEHYKGARIYTKENDYTYDIQLIPYISASISNFPEFLRISLFDQEGKAIQTIAPGFLLYSFSRKFFPEDPTEDFNILLFGVAGSGKSSFINSCYAVLSSTNTIPGKIATSGGKTGHVTKVFKYYALRDLVTKKETPFLLWDTWGLTLNNYSDNDFPLILQGGLPNGWQMEKPYIIDENHQYYQYNEQHCVLFFFTAADLQSESPFLQSTKKYAGIATDYNVPSLYVITQIDLVSSNIRTSDTLPLDPTPIKELIKKAATFFSVEENCVFPLLNYKEEDTKTIRIDKYVYRVIERACVMAGQTKLLRKQKQITQMRRYK